MSVKLRNVVSLSFLVFSKDLPSVVRLKDCSLEYEGGESAGGLITGVYGAQSKQLALVAASNWTKNHAGAKSKGVNRVLMLDSGYRVENFTLTRDQIREDVMEQTGWLHFDRLASQYRDEIKSQWIEWIGKDFGALHAGDAEEASLVDLALKYPKYISRMMKKNQDIKVIIHPVTPVLDPSLVLRAATVRYDKNSFVDPCIRFMPSIQIAI